MPSRPIACLGLLLLMLLARPLQAAVVVVDFANGPGTDYEFLWQAIDAAADGDTLLIRPGYYETWVTVDGRSLTLLGDGAGVNIDGTLTVRHLAAGQRVVLRGLDLGYAGSVELYDNDGVVYVEDCTILADQRAAPESSPACSRSTRGSSSRAAPSRARSTTPCTRPHRRPRCRPCARRSSSRTPRSSAAMAPIPMPTRCRAPRGCGSTTRRRPWRDARCWAASATRLSEGPASSR
jgi:hypothetical protein